MFYKIFKNKSLHLRTSRNNCLSFSLNKQFQRLMIFLLISYFLLSHFSRPCSVCSLNATCDSVLHGWMLKGGCVMMWNNWWLRLFSDSSASLLCGYSSFLTSRVPSHYYQCILSQPTTVQLHLIIAPLFGTTRAV